MVLMRVDESLLMTASRQYKNFLWEIFWWVWLTFDTWCPSTGSSGQHITHPRPLTPPENACSRSGCIWIGSVDDDAISWYHCLAGVYRSAWCSSKTDLNEVSTFIYIIISWEFQERWRQFMNWKLGSRLWALIFLQSDDITQYKIQGQRCMPR